MRYFLIAFLLISGLTYSQDLDEPVDFPDVEAQYPGGTNAMKYFIQNTVTYPAKAYKKGRNGRVHLTFIIETDGHISNVKVSKSSGHRALDKEAIRVVKAMPAWSPGQAKGTKVRTRCRLPISFIIG